jgi:Ser/Thr protein kinase RdoA (MazF antagonist)
MGEIDQRDVALITEVGTATFNERWGIPGSLELLGSVESCVFKSETGDLIVRVTEPIHRSVEALRAELHWLDYLASQGISVALPVKSRRGELLEIADHAALRVCVFRRAPGGAFDSERHWNRDVLGNLGRLLGRMHVATKRYGPGHLRRDTWQQWVSSLQPALGPDDFPILARLEEMKMWHGGLERTSHTYGLVHYDAHYSNFFVDDDNSVTLFDFDDAQYNYFAADLMIPIYYGERSEHPRAADVAIRDALIEAYLQEHSLSPQWLERIDTFAHIRDLELYVWGSQMFDYANLEPKTRRFFERRRERIMAEIEKDLGS